MSDGLHLRDALVILAALLAVVPLFRRLKLGAAIGYVVIGVVIGPSGFGLISADESVRALAELGVVFLLFSIGLELNPDRLRLFSRKLYGLAVAQLVSTAVVFAAVALALDVAPRGALLIGGALAISSTAVVLEVLRDRGLMTSQLGRAAIAILLIQDLAVAPMIALASAGDGADGGLLENGAVAAAAFVTFCGAAWLGNRTVLRPLLRLAAASEASEVFTAAALLLVLGVSSAAAAAGLTMSLGAFIAGVMVADTEFRHQVSADIEPVRGLLLGLFFISVGMSIELRWAAAHAGAVAALAGGLIAVKAALVLALARLFGFSSMRAAALAGLLAQGSEFAFVLAPLAAARGVLGHGEVQIIAVAVTLSMVLTPIGGLLLDSVSARARRAQPLPELAGRKGELRGHVVIAGFGQVGMAVARFLAGEEIAFVVLDTTPRRVGASRERGLPVFYGNAARREVLRAAGLARARALVVAIPDPQAAEQVTTVARQNFRRLRIFVRAPDESWIAQMRRAGADAVVLDSLTTALDLAERVMTSADPSKPSVFK